MFESEALHADFLEVAHPLWLWGARIHATIICRHHYNARCILGLAHVGVVLSYFMPHSHFMAAKLAALLLHCSYVSFESLASSGTSVKAVETALIT